MVDKRICPLLRPKVYSAAGGHANPVTQFFRSSTLITDSCDALDHESEFTKKYQRSFVPQHWTYVTITMYVAPSLPPAGADPVRRRLSLVPRRGWKDQSEGDQGQPGEP